jgi:N-acetylglucosaminyldiphosphoundecaprenol N-acetyl-beta-D-mannosaminyltransferase
MTDDRETVLGVEVDPILRLDLIDRVAAAVRERDRLWVAHHNLHSAYLVLDDPEMQRWFELADVIFVDGMALVAVSRLTRGGLVRDHRATLLDWMPQVLDAAARDGRRVFHLGGEADWIEAGAAVWRERHPGLDLTVHHGYFGAEGSDAVVAAINEAAPDLLLVGMGMPHQERWLAANADRLDVPVIVTVGAFLGYAAGNTAEPPRWTGRVGLEWAWRLGADPKRLARRYLVEPVVLLWTLARR